MKTYIKIITISILPSFAFMTNAQTKVDHKHSGTPFLSKEVVRFSNKNVLEIPHLTVKSVGYPEQVISKDVHKQRGEHKSTGVAGNVVSKGYPDWIISKPVSLIKDN